MTRRSGEEETSAKGGIYNLHRSLWQWLVTSFRAIFRWVFLPPPLPPPLVLKTRLRSSTLHNINLPFRWVDASRPFQAMLRAIFVINYSARYFCNILFCRGAQEFVEEAEGGMLNYRAWPLDETSRRGFHFSKQTAFTFLEVSFRWISAKRWIYSARFFGIFSRACVAKCRCIEEI